MISRSYVRGLLRTSCVGLGVASLSVSLLGCSDSVDGEASGDVVAPEVAQADVDGPEVTLDSGPDDGQCAGLEEGATCDDGNECTLEDSCQSGVCVGGVSRPCEDAGSCQVGSCDPTIGCLYTTTPDGEACSIACFDAATCEGGECVVDPTSATVCPEPDEPCVESLGCDSATGACTVPIYTPQGGGCDVDDNACTFDVCDGAGTCSSTGEIESCEIATLEQPCWTHTCLPKDGSCVQTLFIEGGSCNDLSPCTTNDTCLLTEFGQEACLGTPIDIDDQNPCTDDLCDASGVQHLPIDGASCPTGDACTPTGTCVAGQCEFQGCGCAVDSDCEQPTDKCLGVVVCDTSVETPQCVLDPTTAVVCIPTTDPCMETECVPVFGACADNPLAPGTPCDDGSECTESDACSVWGCLGSKVTCDDGNPCTDESCEPETGCVSVNNEAPCDGGTCAGGQCEPEAPDCEPVVYGHAGQGTNNGWTCEDVCASLGGSSTDWTGVDEQLDYCHTLAPNAETILAEPNNHSYPLYDKQNDQQMCKVNANGWASTANWAGNGTAEYGDTVLCRCQVTDCPCTPGCNDLECGVDDCGNDCGECADGVSCTGGACGDLEPAPEGLVFSDIVSSGVYYWTQEAGTVQIGSCGQPWGLHFVPPNQVYVACIASDSVEHITLEGVQTTLYTSESAFFNARAITQSPTNDAIYVASSTVTSTHVWQVDGATGTVSPYSEIGTLECGGIAFEPDGALLWADFQSDGLVQRQEPGGPITTLIPSFPSGYTLRDMQRGSDGLLYIVGASASGGFRVHQATGELVESLDIPEPGYGVARGPSGAVYVLLDGNSPGVYRRAGDSWELVVGASSGLGTVRVVY